MRKKKNQHGGPRPNSGRKPILDGPIKTLVTLEKAQRRKLGQYMRDAKVAGMSAAMRQIIDNLPGEESDNDQGRAASGSSDQSESGSGGALRDVGAGTPGGNTPVGA